MNHIESKPENRHEDSPELKDFKVQTARTKKLLIEIGRELPQEDKDPDEKLKMIKYRLGRFILDHEYFSRIAVSALTIGTLAAGSLGSLSVLMGDPKSAAIVTAAGAAYGAVQGIIDIFFEGPDKDMGKLRKNKKSN